MILSEQWRLLPYHCGPSDLHFAMSDILVRNVETPTVWFHATDHPTLILGPATTDSRLERAAAQDSNVRVITRSAGGTAVFATDQVLGVDLAVPVGHPLALSDIIATYRWFGAVWVDALRELGIEARTVGIAEARDELAHRDPISALARACFGGLSPYEVVVGGRKIVGLAQVRRRAGVLLQAGIHFHFDAAALARLLAPDQAADLTRALQDRAVGLDEVGGDGMEIGAVMPAFAYALEKRFGVTVREGDWSRRERESLGSLGWAALLP